VRLHVNKVSILVAVSLVLALAIWAVDRNLGSSDLIQQHPHSTPMSSGSSDWSSPPSLVQDETQDNNATAADDDDAELSTFRESFVDRDSEASSLPGDARLEAEPVDADWAPQMESVMWSTISTVGEILEVECRTTICRALVVPSDSESAAVNQNRVLGDSFRSIIASSDGRLDGVRLGFFGTADGRSGITIELSGPPLEAVATDSP
jgi:hypothetical protein